MNIWRRVDIKKSHVFISLLFLVLVTLGVYYWAVLLPNLRNNEREIDQLRSEVTKLQAQLDEKKVYSDCDQEAKDKSRELLSKKIEVAKEVGDSGVKEYQKAYDLGLHLKDDYNSIYENCLRRHGVKY